MLTWLCVLDHCLPAWPNCSSASAHRQMAWHPPVEFSDTEQNSWFLLLRQVVHDPWPIAHWRGREKSYPERPYPKSPWGRERKKEGECISPAQIRNNEYLFINIWVVWIQKSELLTNSITVELTSNQISALQDVKTTALMLPRSVTKWRLARATHRMLNS